MHTNISGNKVSWCPSMKLTITHNPQSILMFGCYLRNFWKFLTNVAAYWYAWHTGCCAHQYKWQHFGVWKQKTRIIAAYIHIGGNNLNTNIVFHGNVDVHWMASSCVLICNNVAAYIRMHGNNTCVTKAELKIKIPLQILLLKLTIYPDTQNTIARYGNFSLPDITINCQNTPYLSKLARVLLQFLLDLSRPTF